jgi:hypothetical protein
MITKFSDSTVANELAEPVIPSLYEIQFIPNAATGLTGVSVDIAREQIKSVSGMDAFERVPALIEQSLGGGAKALFPGVQVDTTVELGVTANLNLRGSAGTEATTLLVLKRMKDKQFNRATGTRGLAKDCVFTVIVRRLTKDRLVWWKAEMKNCLFTDAGITGLDNLDIESDEAAILNFSWRSSDNYAQLVSSLP